MTDVLMILLFILTTVLWIWALIDIYKSQFDNFIFKIFWYVVVVLFPILGSLLYFNNKNKLNLKQRRNFKPNFKNK